MIAASPTLKLAGFSLALGMPLLAPLGMRLDMPWLAPLIVFGAFPVMGLMVGEDRALPLPGLRRSKALVEYLEWLPRIYAGVWIGALLWACGHVARGELSAAELAWLTISIGIGSAVAICTAHELMHRRFHTDVLLGRLMSALCIYGHMYVEHLHHHATLGDVSAGETAPRGMSIYRFAVGDFVQGWRNAWRTERGRLSRCEAPWWQNRMLQDYGVALALVALLALLGLKVVVFFVGQALFAIYCFEVITYVHHYGLVRSDSEEPGPQHAWAHHCWITNCLTFNNTFHSDHHLRPKTPYYELHAMHGAPRLPASYFTMFCIALVPPLWRALMDRRLDALAEERRSGQASGWLTAQSCR